MMITTATGTLAKWTQLLVCTIAVGFIIVVGKAILCPLVFSLLASFLLLPLSRFLESRCRFNRGLSSLLAVVLMVSIITGILFFAWQQAAGLAHDWPKLKTQVAGSVTSLQEKVFNKLGVAMEKRQRYLDQATGKVMNSSVFGSIMHSFSSIMLFLLFLVFDTFFILFYRSKLMDFLTSVFKGKNSMIVKDIVSQVQIVMTGYIVGILIEMTIVTAAACITFSIIGIKYAILLGLLTGLFNIIPYAGIYTVAILNPLFTFAVSGMLIKAIWTGVSIFVIHLVDANILLPVIVGSKVKINAFAAFTGLLVGALIWGVVGIFLSIPVLAILKIIFDHIDRLKPVGTVLGNDTNK